MPDNARRSSFGRRVVVFVVLGALATACGSAARSVSAPSQATPTSNAHASPSNEDSQPSATAAVPSTPCGNAAAAPKRYRSVVVFSFENRTWGDVGLGFSSAMPYLHQLGQQCSHFTDWTEANTEQDSATQYVGQVTGGFQPGVVNDCSPSRSCSTRADNIFRQARRARLSAINYVEGASSVCSAQGNASKHIPDLYMWGADDRAHCDQQVQPLSRFNPNALPSFAFVTPNLCNDGHDCGNETVDNWARKHVQPVLSSAAYRAGKVAVFIWYDEDHPVPNMWITPTAKPGAITLPGAGYAATLRAWESMLGLPCLAHACTAPNMRVAAHA